MRARAFSLVEAVVGAALMASLLALMVMVLLPLARSTLRSTDQADLRQLATVSLERLTADLSSSAAPGLQAWTGAGDVALVLTAHPLKSLTADGTQVWEDHLIVWWHDRTRRQLLRRTVKPAGWAVPSSRASRPPGTLLPTLAVEGRTLAISVRSLSVTGLSENRVAPPLKLRIDMERESTRGPERFSLETTVPLRQHASRSVAFPP